MRDLRNPFRLRRAENIDTDEASLIRRSPTLVVSFSNLSALARQKFSISIVEP